MLLSITQSLARTLFWFIHLIFAPLHSAKRQRQSGDVFEALIVDDVGDAAEVESSVASTVRTRSSSQGSLHSLDDLHDKENSLRGKELRQENKNRLSLKLVKQMKVHKWGTNSLLGCYLITNIGTVCNTT